ncbi:hypothetical protein AURDEDRAFT_166091 [Auricularia subglabra TFB-10046 SS5]|nr:hypothetical protein AURDEDRAFT_166091 [Auricularia subglabra TFB-10046 SS5]
MSQVATVWRRPIRAGSILFYIVRYLGIVSLLIGTAIYSWPETEYIFGYPGVYAKPCEDSDTEFYENTSKAATAIFSAVPALQFSIFWAVELVLQSRIFALYGNRRLLAAFNGFLFSLEIAAMIALWCYLPATCYGELPKQVAELMDGAAMQCDTFALYWIPGIAFELWLAALAFRKLRPQILQHDLLTVMVHDSIRYFFLIAAVMVVHIISAFKGVGDYAIPFVIAGMTIGGSRLVLHLRRAYYRSHGRGAGASPPNILATVRMIGTPVPNSRFADETFYVEENLGGDKFSEEI